MKILYFRRVEIRIVTNLCEYFISVLFYNIIHIFVSNKNYVLPSQSKKNKKIVNYYYKKRKGINY